MTDQMPKTIARLQLDHRNMTRMLALLRTVLDDYRAGGALDIDLLNSIMEYNLNYPDMCHHPLENLIFERMVRREPESVAKLADLLREHAHLGALTRKLAAALQNVSRDSEIPRAWFEDVVESYLVDNEKHIAAEERFFFPQAVLALHPEDWDAIEHAAPAGDDPLFGGKVAQDYRVLYDRIMRS